MTITTKVSKIPATVLHLTDTGHDGRTLKDKAHGIALVVGRAWRQVDGDRTYRGVDIFGITRATRTRNEILAVGDVFEANGEIRNVSQYENSRFFAVTLDHALFTDHATLVDEIFSVEPGTSFKGGNLRLGCDVPTVRKGMFPTVIVR